MVKRLLLHTTGAGFSAAVAGVDLAHRTLSRLPPYRVGFDAVLDGLFGPADSFEYTSTTTPARV
jgi:hypothetical protein